MWRRETSKKKEKEKEMTRMNENEIKERKIEILPQYFYNKF